MKKEHTTLTRRPPHRLDPRGSSRDLLHPYLKNQNGLFDDTTPPSGVAGEKLKIVLRVSPLMLIPHNSPVKET
ncbi:hypothetical protein GN956_G11858 [Arapaima gigas]